MKDIFKFPALILAILITAFFWQYVNSLPAFFDPDTLYHYSVLRELRTQGGIFLNTWSQVPELGWNHYFSDKEFFYHLLLLGPSYFGEKSIIFCSFLFAALMLWLPLFFLKRDNVFAFSLQILIFLNPFLFFRYSLIRPHVLAFTIFTAMIWSVASKKNGLLVCSLIVLYGLSYHAYYLSLMFLILYWAFLYFEKFEWMEKFSHVPSTKTFLYTGFAFLLSIGLNPYFPSNIFRSFQHLFLALGGAKIQGIDVGVELLPMSGSEIITLFGSNIILVIGLFAYIAANSYRSKKIEFAPSITGILCLILGAASLSSPRALELALPISIVFIYYSTLNWRSKWKFLIIIFLLPQPGYLLYDAITKKSYLYSAAPLEQEINKILDLIPNQELTVFHSSWGLGPYIAYHNSKHKIIDLLDPTYLWMASPEKFLLRRKLNFGEVSDPLTALKDFHANYVLAEMGPLGRQLAEISQKNNSVKIIATQKSTGLVLFQILP